MKLSGTELAAMSDAQCGPLVRGRGGWTLEGRAHGWNSNTIDALERKGLLTVVHGPGQKGVATINTEAWLEALT
ncbi:hypothetical protein EFV37_22000 [Mesorhizobium loti]|nr:MULTISPECIES: hypothetical protein [Mesorhizobium]OBQ59603.1 hypothetical protein A9K72_25670 [Mesorhizobium loti]QKC64660.1 hypothetical protein EB229_21995 [Mesorhizobium jarvisii]QKD10574.1 hypothetical protein EFV37_22000 [Mesorhizobium loti]